MKSPTIKELLEQLECEKRGELLIKPSISDLEKLMGCGKEIDILPNGNAIIRAAEVKVDMPCPFCGQKGFGNVGLKTHLMHHCIEFKRIEDLEEAS